MASHAAYLAGALVGVIAEAVGEPGPDRGPETVAAATWRLLAG
ncbi:hypothetical protein [Nocardiopsis sp. CNR-923]|nr:hypothetical protein [Nocardiopsis sp. CNR-923]